MKKIVVIGLVLGLFILPNLVFSADMTDEQARAQAKNICNSIIFDEQSIECNLDNGLNVNIVAPIADFPINLGRFSEYEYSNYYTFTGEKHKNSSTISYIITVTGVKLELTNTSDNVIVIKWAESSLMVNSHSGIPLVEGVHLSNANNPLANLDTLLAPGQKWSKEVYIPRSEYYYGLWRIVGEPMPRNGGLTFDLILKVVDSNNNSKYYNFKTPLMVVK